MKRIIISKDEFERVLSLGCQCATPSKTNFLSERAKISIKGDRIKVEACNDRSSIRTYGKLDCDCESCSFCINCKELADFIKAVSDDIITLELKEDDNSVTIIHAKGECVLPTLPVGDFPEIASIPENNAQIFSISGENLTQWIKYAKDFASKDDARPNITGIYMYCEDGKIGFCATNLVTLVTDEYDTEEYKDVKTSFILNYTSFPAILNTVASADNITITVGEHNVLFSAGDIRLYICRVVSQFPNFRSLFGNFTDNYITFDRTEMIGALKRIDLCCSANLKRVALSLEGGRLGLNHKNVGDNKTIDESMTYEGDCSMIIGFVLDNLMRTLTNAKTDRMRMYLVDTRKPAYLTEDGDDAILSKRFLVSPSIVK